MIDQLLTDQQEDKIIEIIKNQCRRYQAWEEQSGTLFYEPYTKMRQKYSVTAAILSGFAPGQFQIEGITSADLNYGLNGGLAQPELSCESGIFHIYSDGSNLKGKKIAERCKEMNSSINSPPVFFLLIVTVSEGGQLNRVEICLPDQNGEIVSRKSIYAKEKIISITA